MREKEETENKKITIDGEKVKKDIAKEKQEEKVRQKINKDFITGDPKEHIRKRTDPYMGPSIKDLKKRKKG